MSDDFEASIARISDVELRDAVVERFGQSRDDRTLISKVVRHFAEKENTDGRNVGPIKAGIKRASPGPSEDNNASKRPKLESSNDSETWATLADVSVLLPLRKRMQIKFRKEELVLCSGKGPEFVPEAAFRYDTIRGAICTPSPDKATSKNASWTLTLLVDRSGTSADDAKRKSYEYPHSVVFSFDDGNVGISKGASTTAAIVVPPDSKQAVAELLKKALGFAVTEPAVPAGRTKNPHKPQIQGYLGAKQCYFYLLPAGILVGYKKPIMFAAKDQIVDIGLANVTSRTFNIEVQVADPGKEAKTLELAMVDHAAYEDVKDYVSSLKRRREQLASQAASQGVKAGAPGSVVVDLTDSANEPQSAQGPVKNALAPAGPAGEHSDHDESEDEDYLPESESSAEETDSSESDAESGNDKSDDGSESGSDESGEEEEEAHSGKSTSGKGSVTGADDELVEFEDEDD